MLTTKIVSNVCQVPLNQLYDNHDQPNNLVFKFTHRKQFTVQPTKANTSQPISGEVIVSPS